MFTLLIAAIFTLTTPQAEQIGKLIWDNESRGSMDGLTCWNEGEEFASMGINHCIWFPAGYKGPFEETFPSLIRYYQKKSIPIPVWLNEHPPCPWKSKKEFMADFHSPKMTALRQFLFRTKSHQIFFMMERLQLAFPKILEAAAPNKKEHVEKQFERLLASKKGCYVLLDYYNFKGGGASPNERYNDQGWGLLQVLEEMSADTSDPEYEFAQAARKVLKRRVENSPPERHEERWLKGWLKRIKTYN